MVDIIIYLSVFILGIFIGWILAIYRMARNPNFIELKDDEVICKKPPENTVLVAVTPDVARRLVYSADKNTDTTEMRHLRRNMKT